LIILLFIILYLIFIILSINLPDKIIIVNNACVSILRAVDVKIVRDNSSIYQFHFDIDISAGNKKIM